MLTGRVPAAADEVALGASTTAQLGVRPGATLLGYAENERAPEVPMRVVGTAVLPPGDVSAHLGDGVIVTRQALVRLAGGRARPPYVMAATVLLANLISIGPAVTAMRIRPASVLREE
jgi:hypothetical protein